MIWTAKACWDRGFVYGTGDEANGYPWANLVEDFKAVRKYVPKLMRAFLIHFGGGASIYGKSGLYARSYSWWCATK